MIVLIVRYLGSINSCFFLPYERLISNVSATYLPRRILLSDCCSSVCPSFISVHSKVSPFKWKPLSEQMAHLFIASIKLSLIVVFTTQLSIWRNQTRGLFIPWIDDQKRRSLAFRSDTFLENLAIPLRCSYCPRMGQNGLCRTIAMTSSASTSIYEEYWENRTAIRAAERWRLSKHVTLYP